MLSVVNVADYGAIVNDSSDDYSAIQAAINASKAGDTVRFNTGAYNVSKTLLFTEGRTFLGANGSVLNRTGANDHFLAKTGVRNVVVDGLTFKGAGLEIGNAGQNITVRNNTFTGQTWGNGAGSYYAIFMPSAVHDSLIEGNTFTNSPDADTSIVGWGNYNLTIKGNHFHSVNEAIHLFENQHGNVISYNTGTKIGRMAIEVQGSGSTGVLVEYNDFKGFTATSEDGFVYGLSIVTDGTGSVVRNNTIVSYDASKTPYGIEVGGTGTVIEANYVEGFGTGIVLGDSPRAVIRNNIVREGWIGVSKYPSGTAENSLIEGNIFDNVTDYGFSTNFASQMPGSTIRKNTIIREAGHFKEDGQTRFVGIELLPTGGAPFTVTGNVIVVTGASVPNGFEFFGIRVAGGSNTMAGTVISDNLISSQVASKFGVGLVNEVSGALNGVTIARNRFQNLDDITNGASGIFQATGNIGVSSGTGWAGLIANSTTTSTVANLEITVVLSGTSVTMTAHSISNTQMDAVRLFGDETSGTRSTTQHTYAQPATYRPVLMALDATGYVSIARAMFTLEPEATTPTLPAVPTPTAPVMPPVPTMAASKPTSPKSPESPASNWGGKKYTHRAEANADTSGSNDRAWFRSRRR